MYVSSYGEMTASLRKVFPPLCVFITAGPITKLFARDSGGHVLRERTVTREEPGTLTQGAPVFPGSSRLGIEPKTPGWLVQDPTTRPCACACAA